MLVDEALVGKELANNVPPAPVATMLAMFCAWVNSRQSDHTYLPREYTRYDGVRYFGSTMVTTQYNDGWYDVLVVHASDGDEGGPNVFTGYFNEDGALWYMVQQFDTVMQFIYEEGQLVDKEG